jgi:O-antigen ligase
VRAQLWAQAAAAWLSAPWMGQGLAQPVVQLFYTAPDGSHQWLDDAHNLALNLGAQVGVVGLLAFAGIAAWPWWRLRACGEGRDLRHALLIAVAILGMASSFEDARVLWVFIGLCAGAALACPPRGHAPPSLR